MTDLVVTPDATVLWGGTTFRCAIGPGGIRAEKREGDGATPAGRFRLTAVLYRPDRRPAPLTALTTRALRPSDGWCDDPEHPSYNRPVDLPFAASHERLWREDGLYDLLAVCDHNQRPRVAGAGSAVFVHVARAGYAPTAGCVALAVDDLAAVLEAWTADSRLVVPAPA